MFSVQQKRDISDAVQKILRATAHPELPVEGEITFNLKVIGAESWSWADIKNNGAVGSPGVNPHNELMDSIPEEEARGLIDKAKEISDYPDPRATPDDFMKEMLTVQLQKLQRQMQRLEDREKIKDQLYSEVSTAVGNLQAFLQPIMEDNLIQHHSDQIRNLMTAVNQFTGKT